MLLFKSLLFKSFVFKSFVLAVELASKLLKVILLGFLTLFDSFDFFDLSRTLEIKSSVLIKSDKLGSVCEFKLAESRCDGKVLVLFVLFVLFEFKFNVLCDKAGDCFVFNASRILTKLSSSSCFLSKFAFFFAKISGYFGELSGNLLIVILLTFLVIST